MIHVLSLWLFWVTLVALVVVATAPLFPALFWAMDKHEIVGAVAVGAVFMLVWLPLVTFGVDAAMAPWAHSLGLQW